MVFSRISFLLAAVGSLATASSVAPVAPSTDEQLPPGVLMLGMRDLLRRPPVAAMNPLVTSTDASAQVLKTMDDNVAITRTSIKFAQDDRVTMTSKIQGIVLKGIDTETMTKQIMGVVGATPSDLKVLGKINVVVASRSNPIALRDAVQDLLDHVDPSPVQTGPQAEAFADNVRVRFQYQYTDGVRYGWRYPLAYWRQYGKQYYGGIQHCNFLKVYRNYFYC